MAYEITKATVEREYTIVMDPAVDANISGVIAALTEIMNKNAVGPTSLIRTIRGDSNRFDLSVIKPD